MSRRLWFLGFLWLSTLAVAKPAPSFRGELVSGERVSLGDYIKPKKGLLVCFWATWCIPCMEELRMISEKLKSDPNFPLNVVTVNVDSSETSSDVRSTIAQAKLSFPVILDPKHEIFSRYTQGKSLPFSALIDDQGGLASTYEGLNENLFHELQSVLVKVNVIKQAE